MKKKPQVIPWYDKIVKKNMPKSNFLPNSMIAFLLGGALCAAAELAENLIIRNSGMAKVDADAVILIVVVGFTALFTGLGYYDKWAQKAGAALAVPITGFANSVASATIEHKSEGFVLGSGCNSFKLAGAVVVFGIVSAFFVALIKYIIG
ncbi:MAG: SpoVA/SpoVAEb family sporulation membrane protein [Bacillota bacterium]